MNVYAAYKRYFDAAKAAETQTWRTVYTLGLMCAAAANHGAFVAFEGHYGYGSNWPDPRVKDNAAQLRRKDD